MKKQTPSAIEQLAQIKLDRREARIQFYKKIPYYLSQTLFATVFVGMLGILGILIISIVVKVSDSVETVPKLEKRIGELEAKSLSKEDCRLFFPSTQTDRQRMEQDEAMIIGLSNCVYDLTERIRNIENPSMNSYFSNINSLTIPSFTNGMLVLSATNAAYFGINTNIIINCNPSRHHVLH